MIVPTETRKRPALLRLFVDGGSRGNPGPAAAGVVLADADGAPLVEHGYFIGRATNNVAEYRALIHGLALARQFQPHRLEIFADSELIVRQITGQYRVKSPDLIPLFAQAQTALLQFDSWRIRHIPRVQNQRADRMANLAMDRKADVEDGGDDSSSAVLPDGDSDKTAGPAVEVAVTLGCDPRACPVTMMVGEKFRFDYATPAGFCLHAATAVLPAVIELLARQEVTGQGPDRPIRISCPRPGCNARFELITIDG